MNTLQEWVAGGVILLVAFVLVVKFLTIAQEAWQTGDWRDAIQKTIGPLASFAFLVSIGTIVLAWGLNVTYNRIKSSEVVQSTVSWGGSGISALAGNFEVPAISVPEIAPLAPQLQDAAKEITGASKADTTTTNDSAPAWGIVRDANPVVPTRSFIGPVAATPVPVAPIQGPAPAPIQGPSAKPTFVDPASVFGKGGGAQTYTVQAGDSLAKISKNVYGFTDNWKMICEANRTTIGQNCNNIKRGMILIIP